MNILHKVPGFILAELPLIEDGVKHFLSVTPSQVMLHRIVQGAETVTQEMNLPLIRAILQAADSLLP